MLPPGPRDRPRAPKGTLKVSEVSYQLLIVDMARALRWETMHVRRSMTGENGKKWTTSTSIAGWHDLTLWRPPRFVALEVKGHTGHLTPEQWAVLESLGACDGIESYVTWPWEADDVEELLRRS